MGAAEKSEVNEREDTESHEHNHVHFNQSVQVLGSGVPEVIHETSEEHLNDSSIISKQKIEQLVHAEHN